MNDGTRALATRLVATLVLAAGFPPAVLAVEAHGPTDLPPEEGGVTYSLGLPPVYKGTAGVETQWFDPSGLSRAAGYLNLGLSKDLGSPVIGMAALDIEGYLGYREPGLDGGVRGMFMIPSLLVGVGVDHNFEANATDLLLRLDLPVRRGGIFGRGTTLALRYLPGRGNTFGVGINAPLWGSNLGKTRPRRETVPLDARKPARLVRDRVTRAQEAELGALRERAAWIARLTQPFSEHSGADPVAAMAPYLDPVRAHWAETDARFPHGHTLTEEIRAYHETLDRAFSAALGDDSGTVTEAGSQASAAARRILLENVIYPYNAQLGRRKSPDTLTGMVAVAQTDFGRWLLTRFGDVPTEQAYDAFWVFQTLCDIVRENRKELLDRWEDSRLVFLPLQYGLKPEDHDTQEEMNAIVAASAQDEFKKGNRIWYVMNEEFQWELARSVREAEEYHVLWIHDIRGVNDSKKPDEIAYLQVKNYLTALCERVEAYDRTGKIPVYMICLDQHYFEINKSRVWMRLLREPLDHTVDLPTEFDAWEQDLVALQGRLREAVANSVLLRLEAGQYGDAWLRNRIKVHVNITNPADNSFRSHHQAGILPIPDNMMRDHRKIAFYDLTEDDPYKGMAMFTGMGVGEHYVGANWEDRAILVQGPEALAVKDAARQLLVDQGLDAEEMPYPLRSRSLAPDYEEKVAAEIAKRPAGMGEDTSVLQLHNQTGFRPKPIDPAKAALYSLMPPGSLLKVPDSLWQNYLYASLLAGSALRGCRVIIIAPTLESAPSAAAPTMARAHGLLARVITFSRGMDEAIENEGGLLKVGLYAPQSGVGDLPGRFEQLHRLDTPWLRKIYPENPATTAVLDNVRALLDSAGYTVRYLGESQEMDHPKMHLKANFFASAPTWDLLAQRPEWGEVLRQYIVYLSRLRDYRPEAGIPDVRAVPEGLESAVETLLRNHLADLTSEELREQMVYLTVGSVNMDYRSMTMDGEVMILLGGWKSLQGLIDFVLLPGLCVWPETVEELEQYLPAPGGFTRSVAGLMKFSL